MDAVTRPSMTHPEWSSRLDQAHNVEFRAATNDDLPAVLALLNDDQFGVTRNPLYDDERESYDAAFVEMSNDPNNGEIVSVRDGAVIGCYQLTFIRGLSHVGAERAQIESVRISSSLRGGGLGTLMMNDAIERARERGCFQVQLTTDVRREHTKRFYERLGFVASHNGMKLRLDHP